MTWRIPIQKNKKFDFETRKGIEKTSTASAMTIPAIHPGEHLAEELRALDLSATSLARRIEVPTTRITEILNGRRAINGDMALRLAHFFHTSAEFWLNLQKLYELRIAEEKVR